MLMVKLKIHKCKTKKENGFTLLELLVVLSIWTIFILVSAPLLVTSLSKHQEREFLRTLESDVLYIQNLSIGSRDRTVAIQFSENGYAVLNRLSDETTQRKAPPGSIIDYRTNKELTFNKHGSISKPGTISLKTKNAKYNIVFPLGKARCYIEQQ